MVGVAAYESWAESCGLEVVGCKFKDGRCMGGIAGLELGNVKCGVLVPR